MTIPYIYKSIGILKGRERWIFIQTARISESEKCRSLGMEWRTYTQWKSDNKKKYMNLDLEGYNVIPDDTETQVRIIDSLGMSIFDKTTIYKKPRIAEKPTSEITEDFPTEEFSSDPIEVPNITELIASLEHLAKIDPDNNYQKVADSLRGRGMHTAKAIVDGVKHHQEKTK